MWWSFSHGLLYLWWQVTPEVRESQDRVSSNRFGIGRSGGVQTWIVVGNTGPILLQKPVHHATMALLAVLRTVEVMFVKISGLEMALYLRTRVLVVYPKGDGRIRTGG